MTKKTKKILFVITGLGMGGAENQVINLADNLQYRGYSVTIAYILEPSIVLPKNNNVKVIFLHGEKSIKGIFKAYINLVKLINNIRPNIVHSNMYHANIISRLAKLFSKIPKLICTAHSNNEGGIFRMVTYRITNFLGDVFTNVSEKAVSEFESKKAVSKNTMLAMHNGIDTNKFIFNQESRNILRKELKIENKKVFISIGRFDEAKDYPNLLNAFSIVYKKYKDIHLLIVGDGSLRVTIESMIINLNIEESVTLLGIRKDVEKLLSASDIFVLSSAWEGFGLVVAEAMACERIVVSTDCGGVSEVLGNCGFLLESRNSNLLAETMKKAYFLGQQEVYSLGKKAKQRILNKYSLDRVVDKWEIIYS
ncbi:glycosyltransferase [Aliarcobacter cryaerophilus]|uniref:glycosyltransferase n=1 Tax=Aliarcobacter cryaerophilus TaxID=28198 RepID=UPI003DA27737